MRFPAALAVCVLPPVLAAGVLLACGGPVFTAVVADASAPPPMADTGPSGSFCLLEAGTHTFCDDFDGPPLSSKWDSIDQSGGGTAATDGATSDSPPSSLKSVAPAGAGQSHARVIKAFGTASKVVVAFELYIDSTPVKLTGGALGGDSVVGIDVGPSYNIGIAVHTDEITYFENTTGEAGANSTLNSKDLVATSTLQGWTPFVIAIDLAHASLSIAIGGHPLLNGTPITPPSGQTITLLLGAFAHNQAQPLAVHYDNVTIDITP